MSPKHHLTSLKLLVIAALVFGALSGCATSVISSNPRNVMVESYWMDAKEAQRLADAECAKYKRCAKMTIKGDTWDRIYVFECIE